jgi:hypothetical protein
VRSTWTLLVCAGCPYLWAPPEFADGEPPAGGSGSDPTPDTDPPDTADPTPETGTETSDTGIAVDPVPVVTSLTATLRFDRVELGFTVADADGDLAGGTVSLRVDGIATVWPLAGLERWDGASGVQSVPEPVSCDGFSRSYGVVVTDLAGHASAEFPATLTVAPLNIGEGGEPTGLGPLALPAVLCSSHDYEFDYDDWDFQAPSDGTWSVAITHPAGADRDVAIADTAGTILARSEDLVVPDAFPFTFAAGATYRLHTEQSGSGVGDRYTVVISQ